MDADWGELAITVAAPAGASGLERDGMLRRLEDAVGLILSEHAPQGYFTTGDSTDDEIMLNIEAAGVASSDVLATIADTVVALLDEPDHAGWGPYSIEASDAEEYVAGDLDTPEGSDRPDGGTGSGSVGPDGLSTSGEGAPDALDDPAELLNKLLKHAGVVQAALEPAWLTPLDLQAADPQEREQAENEAAVMAGALFAASVVIVDQLFEDLEVLTEDGPDSTVASSGVPFWVLDGLPVRYRHRYTPLFTKELIVATVQVTERFTHGWHSAACVGEELSLRLLLDGVQVQLDLHSLEATTGWRAHLEQHLFEDLDHEMLYDPELDGIEDDAEMLESVSAAPMGFADWFTPFNGDRVLSPYLFDS